MKRKYKIKLTHPHSTPKDSRQGDEEFLADWYSQTGGNNWHDNTGWNNGAPSLDNTPITGVEVGLVGGELRVTSFDMMHVADLAGGCPDGNNCTGTIPRNLGNLTKCSYFNIKTNNITGTIPPSIIYMMELEWCSLGGQRKDIDLQLSAWNENNHACTASKAWEETNAIEGEIPSGLFLLPKLQLFECRRQWLTGALPQTVWYANELVGLFLNDSKGENPLGGGQSLPTRPSDANGLQKLVHFHIDTRSNETIVGTWNTPGNTEVGFVGAIPSEWEELPEIRHFRIRNQNFTGPIPIIQAEDLRVIRLRARFNSGGFPVGYWQKPSPLLNNISISNDNVGLGLTLPDDSEITHPINYDDLQMGDMGFEGEFPDWLIADTNLQILNIRGNNFTGGFPTKILGIEKVKTLYLDGGNQFSGNLPNVPIASRRWNAIFLGGNNFTGGFPSEWEEGMTGSVQFNYFYIEDNLLEGLIPSWFANLWANSEKTVPIRRIRLRNNKFTPKDIIPNKTAIENHVSEDYLYIPQKPFGNAQTLSVGSTIDLSSFDYTGNTYQWLKDGSELTGETSSSIDTTSHGAGIYKLQIIHPDINFTFESEPITVE